MIKRFSVLYVGQIDLDNVGAEGTPAPTLSSRGSPTQGLCEPLPLPRKGTARKGCAQDKLRKAIPAYLMRLLRACVPRNDNQETLGLGAPGIGPTANDPARSGGASIC